MMNVSKDHISGVVFLFVSVVYGYYGYQIPLMPGDEFQVFNAQTLPIALGFLGAILSIILLLTADTGFQNRFSLIGYKFGLVSKLLFLIILFAIALKWIGFMLSTVLFLSAGFWLLGERRPKILLIVSISFSVATWFILSQLLGVYLASGRLFNLFLGN
jgi:putative tricarboxylic transport membrane protein